MGASGPPPPLKNGHFCPEMALKCHFWAKNRVFWALVVSSTPPHPISQVLNQEKHVLQGQEAGKLVIQAPP